VAYKVLLSRRVPKDLDAIPRQDYKRIYSVLRALGEEPRPAGCVKLDDHVYRVRVGHYRIIYSILDDDRTLLITKVARRSESTYRDL
jgi:mRNA interferase RelE/StbE